MKIGFNFSLIISFTHEIIEKFGTITSSPAFKFKDFMAISSAAVPLDTATAYFLLTFFAYFLQIF